MVFWKLSPHLAGALVGKNKYKTRTQALATEFKRQQPKLWKEAMKALKAKTTAEETENTTEANTTTPEKAKTASENESENQGS